MVAKKSDKTIQVGGTHATPKPADIRPLNGHKFSEEAVLETGLSEEEVELLEQQQALENKRLALAEKKEKAKEEAQNQLLADRDKAKEAAANFRKEARNCSDEAEKRNLYAWATEADGEARRIEVELGIAMDVAPEAGPEDSRTFFQRNRWFMAVLQVVGVLIAISYFHTQFNNFRESIELMNEKLPAEKQLQPYDITSIQKLFFEKMVVFMDLPIALLILFLVVPFVGFYVLPFLKSKKDFYNEFFDDLTPWQRSILSTVFILGLLLFLALSHNVKP